LSDQFLQYLNDAAVFSFLDGGDLLLDLPIDTGTLRFAAAAAVEAPAEAGAEEPELSEAAASVTGTVTYLVRMALPDDAVVTVQIQDTSLADAPAVVVGEQVIETGGQQVPIAFEVAYNPDDIQEAKTYTMSARIEDSAGTLLFINDTSIPVITAGNPTQDVEIVTVPASPSTEGEAEAPAEGEADQLTGIVWTWTEFTDPVQGTLPIETPEQYTVEFLEDGTAAIKADCNTGSGSYVAEAGSLDITVGAVTLALCDADSLSDQFLQYLDAAAIYFFEEGDLFMDLPVDSGTLRFTAAAAEARSSTQVATVASLTAVRTTSVAAGGAGNDANGQEPTVPSFKICSVVRDESVFIVTENFPAGEEFVVKMGPAAEPRPMQSQPMPSWKPMPHNMGPMMGPSMGMQGMGAGMAQSGGMWQKPVQKVWIPYYEAGTLESGDGGQLEATFEIPEELAGVYRISIFLRTEHQYPYLAYNWFYNNTADVCNSTNGEA
jgi:putative lipoprotein